MTTPSPLLLLAPLAFLLPLSLSAQNELKVYQSIGNVTTPNYLSPPTPSNWSAGAPSGLGNDLRFTWMPNSAASAVNLDTSAVMDVATLRFNSRTAGTTSAGAVGTASYNLSGSTPSLLSEGYGNFTFGPNNLTTVSSATTPVSLGGTGTGNLSFNGIAGNAIVHANGNTSLWSNQILTYSVAGGGANTTAVVLNSGNLRLSTSAAGLGGVATLEIKGGRLNLAAQGSTTFASASQVNVPVTLTSTLVQTGGWMSGTTASAITTLPIGGNLGQNLTYTQALTGSGGYTLSPTEGGSVTSFRADAAYTGATTLQFAPVYGQNTSGAVGQVNYWGTLLVDGVNGAAAAKISATSSITVRDGFVFGVLNNATASADRINNSAPLNLEGGHAYFTTGSGAYAETMGNLAVKNGLNSLTVGNNGTTTTINGANVAVTFNSMVRNAGDGFIHIRGGTTAANLGASSTGPRLLFTTAPNNVVSASAPGGTLGVLPGVVASTTANDTGGTTTSGAFGFATYGANGVRPLALAEYNTFNTAGGNLPTAGGNLRVNLAATGSVNLPTGSDVEVNSLFISPTGGTTTIAAPAGAERIVFPADSSNQILVNNGQGATIAAPIAFGGEGKIIAANNASQTNGPNFTGAISGSNGLTIGGPGGVNLTGNNTVSGTLTLNGARVGLTSATSIANITAIVAGGSAAGGPLANTLPQGATRPRLQYNGAAGSTLTLSQPIELRSGLLEIINTQFTTSNNTTVQLDGTISGPGGLYIHTAQGGVSGTVTKLTGTNTYSGQTRIYGGTLAVSNDANLGTGTVDFGGGTLRADGNITTSRQLNFSASGTIDTGANSVTLTGQLTSQGGQNGDTFTKTGTGNLTLTGKNPLTIGMTISAGTLTVNGEVGPAGTGGLTMGALSTLSGTGNIYRNVTLQGTSTLSPGTSPGTLTVGGSVTMNAGSNYAWEPGDLLVQDGTGVNFSPGTGSSLSATPVANGTLVAPSGLDVYPLNTVLWLTRNDAPVSGTGAGSIFGVFRDADGPLADDMLGTNRLTFDGGEWIISYNADFNTNDGRFTDSVTAGNDIAVMKVTIPEPTTALLLGSSLLAMVFRRKRR